MARIVTVEQMRAIESEADRKGVSFERMMDNAGKAVFEEMICIYGDLSGKHVVALCGGGNNGGDGLVAAVHCTKAGSEVKVILVAERKGNDPRVRQAMEAGCAVVSAAGEHTREVVFHALETADVVIDAILGTGVQLPLRAETAGLLESIRGFLSRMDNRPFLVAVDCPSGVDCDTADLAPETLPMDLTVALGAAKPGLLGFPAAESVGRLVVADIGLPQDLESLQVPNPILADPDLVRGWLRVRPRASHKGTFGRVMVIGGSVNYPGAPALAGLGAYRAGAGLVTLAVPAPVYTADVSLLPEATWIMLPDDLGVIAAEAVNVLASEIGQTKVLVIGPGFGREKSTGVFLKNLLQEGQGKKTPIGFGAAEKKESVQVSVRPPMVLDADALWFLSELSDWKNVLPSGCVLTPHPGEMAALTGLSKETIQKDRVGTAMRYAREWNAVVVLKGAFSVVAAPDGRCLLEPFATPALARAGTGDVLAGVIGGLIAQGLESWQAAGLGAYVHGRAGELSAVHAGATDSVLARDVARFLSHAIAELRNQR